MSPNFLRCGNRSQNNTHTRHYSQEDLGITGREEKEEEIKLNLNPNRSPHPYPHHKPNLFRSIGTESYSLFRPSRLILCMYFSAVSQNTTLAPLAQNSNNVGPEFHAASAGSFVPDDRCEG